MRKAILFFSVTVILMGNCFADRDDRYREMDRRPHPDAHWHSNEGWLVPALIGGAIVYGAMEASQSAPPVQAQTYPQTVPQTTYNIQPAQPQQPPVGYHYEQMLDPNCNCSRVFLVRN